jgi:hypothetical protein
MLLPRRSQTLGAAWGSALRKGPHAEVVKRWRRHRLVGKVACALGVRRRALEAVFTAAAFDPGEVQRLSLAQLAAFPEVALEEAEKLFYFVQWERLQTHLELCGSLPGDAELAPLLASLQPLFERHFRARIQLSASLVRAYRALFSAPPRACRWPRPCLELLPTPESTG